MSRRITFTILAVSLLTIEAVSCTRPFVPVQLTVTFTPAPTSTPISTFTPAVTPTSTPTAAPTFTPTSSPTPTIALTPPGERTVLSPMRFEWQRLNNCGPASLAMVLSYYGLKRTQLDIAPVVKGRYADKHVGFEEMITYLTNVGLRARVRVNGNERILKALLSNGIPVIVYQLLLVPDGQSVGHYRVVKGYDEDGFILNDSYLGPNLRFSFATFEERWRVFNRRYIPVYLAEREKVVEVILGRDWEDKAMYERALIQARQEVESVGDAYAWFNLGDDHLALGQYEKAVKAYERALKEGLPSWFLWYQFGPLEAYNALGEYKKVLSLSRKVIASAPDIEEVHYQRGLAYMGLGEVEKAEEEFKLALKYNPNYAKASEALAALK